MKVVIQKVQRASVEVDNKIHSKINEGLLVFVGFSNEVNDLKIKQMTDKIISLKIFRENEKNKNEFFTKNIIEKDFEILIVSQFTLFGRCHKGSKIDYSKAKKGDLAILDYNKFVNLFKEKMGEKVKTGAFGEMMKINIVNDGPTTILIEK